MAAVEAKPEVSRIAHFGDPCSRQPGRTRAQKPNAGIRPS